jgi:hypothetical protein
VSQMFRVTHPPAYALAAPEHKSNGKTGTVIHMDDQSRRVLRSALARALNLECRKFDTPTKLKIWRGLYFILKPWNAK